MTHSVLLPQIYGTIISRYSAEEFYFTLFHPLFELELDFLEAASDKMMGGIAEIASGLNNEKSMIAVNVKEIKAGKSHINSGLTDTRMQYLRSKSH
jgi:hypothetical protein